MIDAMLTVDHVGEGIFPTWLRGTIVRNLTPCPTYRGWWQGDVNGLQSYFPTGILLDGYLRQDYNPTELALPAGSCVQVLAIFGAWAWVRYKDKCGWLPTEKLQSTDVTECIP